MKSLGQNPSEEETRKLVALVSLTLLLHLFYKVAAGFSDLFGFVFGAEDQGLSYNILLQKMEFVKISSNLDRRH